MMEIKEQAARVVAGDAQSAAAAIDLALLQQSRLCASVIEASGEAKLAMSTTQPLLSTLAAGFIKMVEGRADVTATMRELQAIQSRSNLREVGFGCPGGSVGFVMANATQIETMKVDD